MTEQKTDDVKKLFDEINKIEINDGVYIKVNKKYSDGKLIELQGLIYKIKYQPSSYYQKYEEEYLYKGDIIYGFEDDEHLVLKNTLDFYKNKIQ